MAVEAMAATPVAAAAAVAAAADATLLLLLLLLLRCDTMAMRVGVSERLVQSSYNLVRVRTSKQAGRCESAESACGLQERRTLIGLILCAHLTSAGRVPVRARTKSASPAG